MDNKLTTYNKKSLTEQKPEIVYETVQYKKSYQESDIDICNFIFFTKTDTRSSEGIAKAVIRVANALKLHHEGAFVIDSRYNGGRRYQWQIIVSGSKKSIEKFIEECNPMSSELVYNYLEVGGKWIPKLSGL